MNTIVRIEKHVVSLSMKLKQKMSEFGGMCWAAACYTNQNFYHLNYKPKLERAIISPKTAPTSTIHYHHHLILVSAKAVYRK